MFITEYPCYFCSHLNNNPVCDSCLNFYDYVLAKESIEKNFHQLYVEKSIVEYCVNCSVAPVVYKEGDHSYCTECLSEQLDTMYERERMLQPTNPFLWDM